MQGPSSPTREWICNPCSEGWSLNYWTTREVPYLILIFFCFWELKKYLLCGWKMLPTVTANKRCCGHPAISHYQALMVSPEWAQDGGKRAAIQQALSHCNHPQRCALRGLRMEKNWILALDTQGVPQRNDFSEPRLLHLPILRKAGANLKNLRHLVFFY